MIRFVTACAAASWVAAPLAALAEAPAPAEVMTAYADIAEAGYADSLATAEALQTAVAAFLAAPSDETLAGAKAAWVAARVPYQQTEAFRFGNAIVNDWEGRVNAWPLDEGLIDYVDLDSAAVNEENDYALLNIIANPKVTIGGTEVDATEITPVLLGEVLHEAEGIEANVATGYHAIEFLLWGQDLNGTDAGAGARQDQLFRQSLVGVAQLVPEAKIQAVIAVVALVVDMVMRGRDQMPPQPAEYRLQRPDRTPRFRHRAGPAQRCCSFGW